MNHPQNKSISPLLELTRQPGFKSVVLVLGLALIFSGIGVLAQDSRPDSHAIDPAAFAPGKQLDFWIGTWDLTWKGGRGTNVVNKVLDDRVIQENFTGSAAIKERLSRV